ncbi:MAG TPA: NAD+ synthase [Marinilabiliales bacterium]|nr:MAG: NAD+ synthase [Bacteroidetes bacterium GWD2_40_43]OFX93199.1 MAG: NAD+ synthase [Bacteroidetes bacterium GWE2_40_63]OFY21569.1 MAG: NAD+ synthase [Bacteroidetes bacterium GWF2_40_13]OFZ24223.1 MAG: NAD+ synthase [Bacteroidetes bacterium RIFOXYC2_FULL_40_12]HAM98030.1 NAD+ synthase [Marinilabiliales bacterium]
MKIALAQLNYHVGNFDLNNQKMAEALVQAEKQGAELVIFSELSVCGYPPHDMLEQHDFIIRCNETVKQLAARCINVAAIVGVPTINPASKGKKLFNSACLLANGQIMAIRNKTLLPTYDIFDEYRYFEPNETFELLEWKGEKIALTICEDLWDKQPSAYISAKGALYKRSPMSGLAKLNPDYIINIAASPYSYNQGKVRIQVLKENAERYQLPVIYVNQTGGNTELIFDGDSMVLDAQGNVVAHCGVFNENLIFVDTQALMQQKYKPELLEPSDYIAQIHEALVVGIRDYFGKMHFKKATLGLSGGIDSAVTLVLAAEALGGENLRVLLMPSKYSSDHSINDAVDLAENLHISYEIVPIQPIVDTFEQAMGPLFKGLPADVTEENIQARVRGTLLMALSNKFGHILLNTSNKSEAAVGYGTLYGDMNGGLSVLGDVYKTDVFKLAHYMNRDKEIIPVNTILKPPSAELRPNQKDSDSLPEYDLLDAILFQYIEQKLSASEIIALGYPPQVVEKVLRLVNINEYKRFQAPPILRISSKAFGFGRRMPLVARY